MGVALLLLAACAPSPPAGQVSAALHPVNSHAAVVRVSVDADADVHVAWGEAGSFDRTTPEMSLAAGQEADLLVLGLRAGRTYTLSAVVDDGRRVWSSATQVVHTPPLPPDWPWCEVESTAPPGTFGPDEVVCTDFFLGDSFESHFACVDREGEPVFRIAPDQSHDFMTTTVLLDGGFASTSSAADRVTVHDAAGAQMADWSTLWLGGRTRFVHDFIDGHEILQLHEGPWAGALAFITYTAETWKEELRYGGGIVVLDPATGEVLWDWTAHGELGDGEPVDPALDYDRYGQIDYEEDWQHANALVHGLDDDGGQFFWVSLRHQDWLVKVDVESDAVEWRLGWGGDFALVEDLDDADSPEADPSLWFYHQHAPELQAHQDGRARFLVFDNGNVRVDADGHPYFWPAHSRVVEMEIDEHTRRAQVTWSHGPEDSADPDYFYAWGAGDANMLPGGDRVQLAVGVYSDDPHIAEVSYPEGEVLWRLTCDPVEGMYRVGYLPSLYERTWWYDVER